MSGPFDAEVSEDRYTEEEKGLLYSLGLQNGKYATLHEDDSITAVMLELVENSDLQEVMMVLEHIVREKTGINDFEIAGWRFEDGILDVEGSLRDDTEWDIDEDGNASFTNGKIRTNDSDQE